MSTSTFGGRVASQRRFASLPSMESSIVTVDGGATRGRCSVLSLPMSEKSEALGNPVDADASISISSSFFGILAGVGFSDGMRDEGDAAGRSDIGALIYEGRAPPNDSSAKEPSVCDGCDGGPCPSACLFSCTSLAALSNSLLIQAHFLASAAGSRSIGTGSVDTAGWTDEQNAG